MEKKKIILSNQVPYDFQFAYLASVPVACADGLRRQVMNSDYFRRCTRAAISGTSLSR